MRTEQEIFDELGTLSSKAGFLEIVAFFCWKDTFIHYHGEKLDGEAFTQQFDRSRLSRTELSTLLGLACKNGFEIKQLSSDDLKVEAERVWHLLDELHHAFYQPVDFEHLLSQGEFPRDAFGSGTFMREAIFYSGEGVFKHQYRDLAKLRYVKDDKWIEENKGFKISQAVEVISVIEKIQLDKANGLISAVKSGDSLSYLPIFTFTISDIMAEVSLSKEVVTAVVHAFSATPNEGMSCFNSVDDFNHRNAFPIIKLDDDNYLSFQPYSLWEALYESPFFWFNSDKAYSATASKHRGAFTEDFTADRLASVFGKENVLTNIDIFDGKSKAGEIDVLVTFGRFAMVVQAKSKKLTIAARKGNSQQLESDFKKAVQDAYDQALLCSQLLLKDGYTFKNESGEELKISSGFKTIFPICIVSDHFPALSAQARQFLTYEVTDIIKHPYVMDVFLIDMITEMLASPLRVLDYFTKRSDFGDSILSNHELVILATYIMQNLYFQEKPDLVMLEEDISADLELAMLARRDGIDAPRTPKGFLTTHKGTYVGSILDDIQHSQDYGLQKLGFFLLSMSGDSIKVLNDAISKMIIQFKRDNQHHDISLPFLGEKTGLTVHCNVDDNEAASKRLIAHCEKRKYTCEADSWVGFCFSPTIERFRFATYHESEWQQSDKMDELVADLQAIGPQHQIRKADKLNFGHQSPANKRKVGRNEQCPCGSGKKFKQCCLA